MGAARLLIATELGSAGDGVATAAALGVAVASSAAERSSGGGGSSEVVVVELGAGVRRRPTLLSSAFARSLEERLAAAGFERPAARGRVCWVGLAPDDGWRERLRGLTLAVPDSVVVVHMAPVEWRQALDDPDLAPCGALIRADVPAHRHLLALSAAELGERDVPVRVAARALGLVGARRALAGLDPGGPSSARMARIARALAPGARAGDRRPATPPPGQLPPTEAGQPQAAKAGPVQAAEAGPARPAEAGQALPLVIGAAFTVILVALALAALGGAVTGISRVQRAADLAALSAARSMRDDLPRLTAPERLPDSSPNPAHLEKAEYLARAEAAGREAAVRNEVSARRVEVSFPDAGSPVPVRARVILHGERRLRAEAQASPPGGASAPTATASGGGYAGPLSYRQGKPMRPDVAVAFNRLAAAASRDGVMLLINSAYRSDAEQARLFAQNPDPRWVAPPGTSLHRCGTELDLGPAGAYGWLAANAPRFGFTKRYEWEPWHFGFTRGPAPCSAELSGAPRSGSDRTAPASVPAFVPARFRPPLVGAASRWNVSATLLAAQLEAESGFDPNAVSPAGAQGIAQFIPSTAAAYGLRDPFDPAEAIAAQAHLMSDLLGQFGSIPLALAAYNAGPAPVAACNCVPPYPETQAYVARILALAGSAGALVEPLEVRLVG